MGRFLKIKVGRRLIDELVLRPPFRRDGLLSPDITARNRRRRALAERAPVAELSACHIGIGLDLRRMLSLV